MRLINCSLFYKVFLVANVFLIQYVNATPSDQAGANVNLGTFTSPAALVKPRFRYWLPDSSVDADVVAADIKAAGSINSGGVEFLPFYNYGGDLGPPPASIDWSIYGFGSAPFKELLRSALQAHKDAGLIMDLALGPNQGQGVPAEISNDGLQWDLIPYTITISSHGSFEGRIPGWTPGARLVALNTAQVLSRQENSAELPPPVAGYPPSVYNWTTFVINETSLTESTSSVDERTGMVSIKLPGLPSNQTYQLIASYESKTLNHACIPGTNPQNFLQNGSFVVDHFSERGARVTTDFWDDYVFDDDMKALLKDVGNYVWEDSMEIRSTVNWTPNLPEMFEKKFGYRLQKYIPLILYGNNNINIQSTTPGQLQFVTNADDRGQSFVNDYRAALAEGYQEYMKTIQSWASRTLEMQTSLQVSYNLPMDALANVPTINAPETETIQFGKGAIDSLRQFAGPANLAGKRVLSCEMAGVFYQAHQLPVPQFLFLINRGFAGGVNSQVIHGQSYSGSYPNTTWPGYTAFNYLVAENWSPRQPSWDNGFGDVLQYTGRTSFTQQSGIPKIDVVFYQKNSVTDPNFGTHYEFTDLIEAGYTYQYISPDNFQLPRATIKNKVLAFEGPEYKALIIDKSDNLTLIGASKMLEYAEAGLPIIFTGGAPGIYPEDQNKDSIQIGETLNSILSHENVFQSQEGELAQTLAKINIKPRISVQGSSNIYTTWRQVEKDGIDYAFVFSDVGASNISLTISTTKIPYIFDAWTGIQEPLTIYKKNSDSITVSLSLAANQTTIFAFSQEALAGVDTPNFHLEIIPSNIVGSSFSSTSGLIVQAAKTSITEESNLLTSNGKTYSGILDSSLAAPFTLNDWILTAEHWDPPSDLYDLSIQNIKRNTTHVLKAPLPSWTLIPGLNETAGLGYYSTNFTWSKSSLGADGAIIMMQPIINTARLYVNGKAAPPLDLTAPKSDITEFLLEGENEILIVTSTSLWNAIRPRLSELESSGRNLASIAGAVGPAIIEGLIGDVTILPFKNIVIPE